MKRDLINAPDAHDRKTGYSQAVAVHDFKTTLYISGQIPVRPDGSIPVSFANQARLTWANLEKQLHAANMDLSHIVKHTTYLSARDYCDENSRVRREVLGSHEPALTVIIAGIFDEAWLLEINAVAVK